MSSQMGPLSALERLLCIDFALARTNTRAHRARLRTIILSRFRSHAEGTRRKARRREEDDNSELRTRQSHLLAEVLHLINASRLHCALNHAQIKKLVIFNINGGRGRRFDSFLAPAAAGGFFFPPTSELPPSVAFPTLSASPPPPPPPQWSCSSVSVKCTNSFTSIIYSAFRHYLLLLFHLFLTPLSYQLSSQSHILISTHFPFTSSP